MGTLEEADPRAIANYDTRTTCSGKRQDCFGRSASRRHIACKERAESPSLRTWGALSTQLPRDKKRGEGSLEHGDVPDAYWSSAAVPTRAQREHLDRKGHQDPRHLHLNLIKLLIKACILGGLMPTLPDARGIPRQSYGVVRFGWEAIMLLKRDHSVSSHRTFLGSEEATPF